ncbi:MAG TPA: class I SAM-dependent methyltransferase [Armatimonadota bacterium]|jgi:2-polyprenyl-3-methyl-5-hydroxy-6-metoxy-1,4-benzoquinol methylase
MADSARVAEHTKPQGRWNQSGRDWLEHLRTHPEKCEWCVSHTLGLKVIQTMLDGLGPLQGLRVLELGCGHGALSVILSQRGAQVTGVDLGPDLLEAASLLAKGQGSSAVFERADIRTLPYPDGTYDLVVGRAILHHVSVPDVRQALKECHRVLKPGGRALFVEPVENSALFAFLQNLVPAGRQGTLSFRPSILQRRAWARYVAAMDDRDMTTRELLTAGAPFASAKATPLGVLIRLERVMPKALVPALETVDDLLLKLVPPARSLCREACVEYRK